MAAKTVQIKQMRKLIELYQNDGTIKDMHYDETSETYTFIYNTGYAKGGYGAISLKTFNPYFN